MRQRMAPDEPVGLLQTPANLGCGLEMAKSATQRLRDYRRVSAAMMDRRFLKAQQIEVLEVGPGAYGVDCGIQPQAELDIPRADSHTSSMSPRRLTELQNVGMASTDSALI